MNATSGSAAGDRALRGNEPQVLASLQSLAAGLLGGSRVAPSSVAAISAQRGPAAGRKQQQKKKKHGGAAAGGGSSPAPRGTLALFFERHFAGRSAVRDFNASMPVVVLPSDFSPAKGVVVDSRPGDRVPVLEPLDPRSDDAVADLM